ncbi:MAG: NfeD family protein [Bacteroidales bacterium]|nr:NfeD family protein [Bacteroidales bacterium]
MTWTVIIVLIIIGFLFLLLEVLVLPGTNIAGVLGFILIAIGVWQAYTGYGTVAGTVTLGGSLAASFVSLYFALKSKTWSRASLKTEINGRVNLVDISKLKPGDTGKTVSRLNPMGKAFINGEYYEVKTTGEYLEPGTEIEVLRIEQSKITVKSIKL